MRLSRRAIAATLTLAASFALHRAPADETSDATAGAALYQQHCGACHETPQARAPARATLAKMSPDAIRYALTKGVMQAQGAGLTPAQINDLIAYLAPASSSPVPSPAATGFCTTRAPLENPLAGPYWSGWGNGPQQQRFQSASAAGIDVQSVAHLQLKWAFAFPDATQAASQPAVAGGRVFVGSANGNVYALDARTGCSYWVFHAGASVRTALSIGPVRAGWAVFFGDQAANAYAVDASSGALLWKVHLDPHPAAMVTGARGTFRGSVSALDAATGNVIWKSSTISEPLRPVRKNKTGTQLWGPSGAAVWSSPTIDAQRHALYVATGDSYSEPAAATSDAFIAFDLGTGRRLWYRQMTANDIYTTDCGLPLGMRTNCPVNHGHDFDFGSSPILVRLSNGHRALIAGQKSGIVHAIDPDRRGAVLWQRRVGRGGSLGGVQWGSAADSRNVYVAVSDVDLKLARAGTAGAQTSIFGPSFLLNPAAGGGLFALDLTTGNVAWHTPHPPCVKPGCSPAQSAAVTAIPGVVFSGGLDGHLRAYSARDGRMLWDTDTERSYETVNGVAGMGGSLDGPGAVLAGGMLYVNSGYAYLGSAPGNVLLAFSIEGR
jgi:polyvinyl alcohol dehydrogenase (cytochrome)